MAKHCIARQFNSQIKLEFLTAEGQDRTKVTITWEPYGTCTDEEFDTFSKSLGGMKQGWTGSFDKLEDYLLK